MSGNRRSVLLIALVVVLSAQALFMALIAAYLVTELFAASPESLTGAIALTVLVVIAALLLAVVAVHTFRGAPWVRGAIVVWQVLQIAVAVGSFQGAFARPEIGWVLLIPAVAALILLFTPSVVAATRRV